MENMASISVVREIYDKIQLNIQKFQEYDSKPLTFTEKIFIGHLSEPKFDSLIPGQNYIFLKPDRVALQDASGQMVLLQFMQSKLSKVSIPTTLHCDHLIQAKISAGSDIKRALFENNEVYNFLESSSKKFGIGFWKPGAGIIHQVLLENYAFPGGLIIGTDSHTPNSGGLGMMGIGVGGIDASEVMAGLNWEVLYPERIGVYLTGELNGWASPKDVILYLTSVLTVSGATNCVIEYFGPGTKSISCTGKATITNMGAEIGATSSIFPLDVNMINYLNLTNRKSISNLINEYYNLFTPDKEIENNPTKYFNRVIEINLSDLEPYVVGPHTPDLARPISQLADDVHINNYIDEMIELYDDNDTLRNENLLLRNEVESLRRQLRNNTVRELSRNNLLNLRRRVLCLENSLNSVFNSNNSNIITCLREQINIIQNDYNHSNNMNAILSNRVTEFFMYIKSMYK